MEQYPHPDDPEKSSIRSPVIMPDFEENRVSFFLAGAYPQMSFLSEEDSTGEEREVAPFGVLMCPEDNMHALQFGRALLWEVANVQPVMVKQPEYDLGEDD